MIVRFVGYAGFLLYNAKYNPIGGGYYIELPKYLANKKALINIQNLNNNRCFYLNIILGKNTPENIGHHP